MIGVAETGLVLVGVVFQVLAEELEEVVCKPPDSHEMSPDTGHFVFDLEEGVNCLGWGLGLGLGVWSTLSWKEIG